jgi:hypothetical protein
LEIQKDKHSENLAHWKQPIRKYKLTTACYGDVRNKGKFGDTETATNHHILVSATYFFKKMLKNTIFSDPLK